LRVREQGRHESGEAIVLPYEEETMPVLPSGGGVQFVTRCRYLTARCPGGCESWLHPRAVGPHAGRCRGKPWVDDVEDSALVPQPVADLFCERLPARLIGPVEVSQDRALRLRSHEGVRNDVLQGVVVRSPIEGVRARRWVYIVRAAVEGQGPDAIGRALTSAGFDELERELDVDDQFVDCPDCGETVRRSRVNLHRTKSTLCRWRRARGEVRALWAAGWRDPFTVPGAPLSWGGLQAGVAWRRRTRTIEFPLWVAVLLSPPHSASVSVSCTPGYTNIHSLRSIDGP
jgi:hypothetical protein